MKTALPAVTLETAEGQAANAILRRCVHCGFCNSACPTYLQLGDESNGPRGRIYQMKNFLESGEGDSVNLANLDLCLTCQACESACPSGVRYIELLEIVRPRIAAAVGRSVLTRLRRRLALTVLLTPPLLKTLLAVAALFHPLLPANLRAFLPPSKTPPPTVTPPASAKMRVVLFDGCAQSAMRPDINAAATAVLARLGIAVEEACGICCGALSTHLEDKQDADRRIRANVDLFYDYLQRGADKIVSTASGCGRTVADYARYLEHDAAYADKAKTVSAAHCDLAELLMSIEDLSPLKVASDKRFTFHCPCTLQHGQRQGGAVAALFARLGGEIETAADGGRCCGAAGFYATENPRMGKQLREQRLEALLPGHPDAIITANIGCQLHLQGATEVPVLHWIQAVNSIQCMPPRRRGTVVRGIAR